MNALYRCIGLVCVCALWGCEEPTRPTKGAAYILAMNHLGVPITEVRLYTCTAPKDSTVENRLGPRETLSPEAQRVFEVESGCYDAALFTTDSGNAQQKVAERARMELMPKDTFKLILRK